MSRSSTADSAESTIVMTEGSGVAPQIEAFLRRNLTVARAPSIITLTSPADLTLITTKRNASIPSSMHSENFSVDGQAGVSRGHLGILSCGRRNAMPAGLLLAPVGNDPGPFSAGEWKIAPVLPLSIPRPPHPANRVDR